MSTYVKINDMFLSTKISFKPEEKFTLSKRDATSFVHFNSATSWIISNIDYYYRMLKEIGIQHITSIKVLNGSEEKDVTDFVIKRRFISKYTREYGPRTKPLFNDLINKNIEYSNIIICEKRKLEHTDLVDLRNLLKDFLGSTRDFKIVSGLYDWAIGFKNDGDASTIRLALDADYSCKVFSPPTLKEFKDEFEDYKNFKE